MVRTCVSAYSWEALAYLALNKKIVLDLTPCGECENDVCAEHLRAVLTRLVEFFGQALFEPGSRWHTSRTMPPSTSRNIPAVR